VNLASRLQASARPGTILVTEQVYRQMRLGFKFRKPVKINLRGIDEPVVAYELIEIREDPEPMRGLVGRSVPLIGREHEYELIITHLEKIAIEQQGMVAVITGDAGVGKTRLLDEILLPDGLIFRVVRTQCSEYEMTGYGLIREMLLSLAEIDSRESLPNQKEYLYDFLSQANVAGEEIPSIIEGIIFGKSLIEEGGSELLGYQKSLVVALRRILGGLLQQRPIAMLFDDIQWADSSSLDLLSYLVSLTFEMPLAMIFLARSEYREILPEFLCESSFPKKSKIIKLHLQSLTYEQSDQLIESLLSEIKLPQSLKQNIYARTSGNPFYIEEFVRVFIDEEVIYLENGDWILEELWIEFFEKVPETVTGLLLSRYDRQPGNLKMILDAASVFGQSFHLKLLSMVLEMTDSELRNDIKELLQADFLRRSSGFGSEFYSFRHALLRDAI